MKLVRSRQIDSKSLPSIHYDALIVSSGYESRATYLCRHLKDAECEYPEKKYCLSFDEHAGERVRSFNDFFFKEEGFTMLGCSGNMDDAITSLLDEIMTVKTSTVSILIDYSCMTRVWYAYILQYLSLSNKTLGKSIEVYFSYSVSEFTAPPKKKIYNGNIEPIDGFFSLTTPNKPTALVIGLGYLEEQAFGLAEFFDSEPFLFITAEGEDDIFFKEVQEQNKILLGNISTENIYYYSIENLDFCESLLYSLCRDLSAKYRIVLAPCGPKPFTLLCLITSLKLNVDVWRISPGVNEIPVDKKASGKLSVFNLSFQDVSS